MKRKKEQRTFTDAVQDATDGKWCIVLERFLDVAKGKKQGEKCFFCHQVWPTVSRSTLRLQFKLAISSVQAAPSISVPGNQFGGGRQMSDEQAADKHRGSRTYIDASWCF